MDIRKNIRIGGIIIFTIVGFYVFGSFLNKATETSIGPIQVVLNAKVLKDDTFQLFYTEAQGAEFEIAKSVRSKVKGSVDYQEIKFQLPLLNDLAKLRLDIGENFQQGTVVVKGISFIREDNTQSFDINGFNALFSPNDYVKKSTNGNEFTGLTAKIGSDRVIYDPGFYTIAGSDQLRQIKASPLTRLPFVVSGFVFFVIGLALLLNVEKVVPKLETVFISVFLLLIIIPVVQKQVRFVTPLKSLEKRTLASSPKFQWSTQYARDYETYFNDNFGFRNHLVNLGSTIKTKLFRSSTRPELVTFGKDKWLYYNRLEGRIFRSYTRTNLYSRDTLQKIVRNWEDNRNKFNGMDIKYVLGFWPNKQTIYPEYLPSSAKMQIRDTLSRIDQLLEVMDSSLVTVKLTDVRSKLKEEKKNNQLYHKFDSHWNSYGAFVGYQEFFNRNIEVLGMRPKSLKYFDVKWEDYNQGELIQMLGINNRGFFLEKNPVFTPKENKNQIEYLPVDGFPPLTVITRNNECGNNLRALVFRDSYTNSLIQFFSLHFHEVYYIWGFREGFVDQLKPNVIIEGFVEREIGETFK